MVAIAKTSGNVENKLYIDMTVCGDEEINDNNEGEAVTVQY